MIDDLIRMETTMPPKVTEDLASVGLDAKRLMISGSTRNLDRLAEMKSLEAVWAGDLNEAQFLRIVSLIDPEYVMFNGVRVADLSPIARLRRLEALEVIWDTKVTDISFLEQLPNLRLLGLSDCPKVRDISPIAALTGLEVLDLSGGIWNVFRPFTLKPLEKLTNLWGLSLKNIRVGDQSLEPVAGLKNLRVLELSNQFPTAEYARLSVALPHVQCDHFEPYLDFHAGGLAANVMVTGKGKPVLKLPDQQARLNRYIAQFRALQDDFRSQYQPDS